MHNTLIPISKSRFDIEFSDDRLDTYFYKITDKFICYNVDQELSIISNFSLW